MVKTIPGSTTPDVRGSNGSVKFSFVIGLFLILPSRNPVSGKSSE